MTDGPPHATTAAAGAPELVPRWLAAVAPVATLLCLCPGAILRGESFYLRDLEAFHRPMSRLAVRLWRETGELPTWNRYSAFGQPFAANPNSGIFHPFLWPTLLLPFEVGLILQTLLPIAVAHAATYLLVRTRGGSRLAATVGAASFSFGGAFLSATAMQKNAWAYAPLPAALALLTIVLRSPAPAARTAAALALALAMVALSGEPTALLATALACGALLLLDRPREVSLLAAARRFAAPVVLGGGIAAAVLLPAANVARHSERAHGLDTRRALEWSMPAARLLELLIPPTLGSANPTMAGAGPRRDAELYPNKGAPYLLSLYAGLLPLVLAAVAVVRDPRPLACWLLAAGAGTLVAMGSATPIGSLYAALGLRYPERAALLPCLCLSIIAARGTDLVRARAVDRRRATVLLPLAGLAMVLTPDLVSTAAIAAAGLLALWLLGRGRTTPGAFLLVLVLAVDLLVAGRPLLPTRATTNHPPPVLRQVLAAGGGPMLDATALDPRRPGIAAGTTPPVPASWGIATSFEIDPDLTAPVRVRALGAAFHDLAAAAPRRAESLLARLGVRLVLDSARHAGEMPTIDLVAVPDPAPFAFCPATVLTATDPADWQRVQRRLPRDDHRAIVLMGHPPPSTSFGGPCIATVRSRTPTRIEIEVVSEHATWLALNQTWDPGWRATIDGRTTPLQPADIALAALAVPPGRHVALLRHRDPVIRWSLALSGLCLAGALAAALRGGRPAPSRD